MKNVPTHPASPESWRAWRDLVADDATVNHKRDEISALIRACPGRQFILIGDSGEKDPEIYASIRQDFPGWVKEIVIRDILGDAGSTRLRDMTIMPV
jgi:phosphatidate phosphatase APP1